MLSALVLPVVQKGALSRAPFRLLMWKHPLVVAHSQHRAPCPKAKVHRNSAHFQPLKFEFLLRHYHFQQVLRLVHSVSDDML